MKYIHTFFEVPNVYYTIFKERKTQKCSSKHFEDIIGAPKMLRTTLIQTKQFFSKTSISRVFFSKRNHLLVQQILLVTNTHHVIILTPHHSHTPTYQLRRRDTREGLATDFSRSAQRSLVASHGASSRCETIGQHSPVFRASVGSLHPLLKVYTCLETMKNARRPPKAIARSKQCPAPRQHIRACA